MSEKELRETLQMIQEIFKTPTSSIAKEIGIHNSLIGRFINDKMGNSMLSEKVFKLLEDWCNEKIELFKEQLGVSNK